MHRADSGFSHPHVPVSVAFAPMGQGAAMANSIFSSAGRCSIKHIGFCFVSSLPSEHS
jgi:hypothetical protein